MAQQLIDIGNAANDEKGDPGRIAFDKVNDNFTDLYTNKAEVNYISVVTAERTLTDSELTVGRNIIGVNYSGEVIITLPDVSYNKIITIKDELGDAATNKIAITAVARSVLPPTSFSIDSVTSNSATVSWTPPVRGTAIGYRIYYGLVTTRVVAWGIGSSTTIPLLSSGIEYTMYIVTYDNDGESTHSNSDTATTS